MDIMCDLWARKCRGTIIFSGSNPISHPAPHFCKDSEDISTLRVPPLHALRHVHFVKFVHAYVYRYIWLQWYANQGLSASGENNNEKRKCFNSLFFIVIFTRSPYTLIDTLSECVLLKEIFYMYHCMSCTSAQISHFHWKQFSDFSVFSTLSCKILDFIIFCGVAITGYLLWKWFYWKRTISVGWIPRVPFKKSDFPEDHKHTE